MWALHSGCGWVLEEGVFLRAWAPSPEEKEVRASPGRGWGGIPTPTQPPSIPPPLTFSVVSTPHVGPPSGSEPTTLHHRLCFGASSHTFYFSFCTAKYSFQMCLLTDVTFLVLLTCSFFF